MVHNPVRLIVPLGHGRRLSALNSRDELPVLTFKYVAITDSCLRVDDVIFPDFTPHYQPYVEPGKPKKKKASAGGRPPASDQQAAGGTSGDSAAEQQAMAALEEKFEAQKDELREKFESVAESGKVDAHAAQTLARQLGLSPSFADQEAFATQNPPPWDFTNFKKYLAAVAHPEDNESDFADALSTFADGSGSLSEKQLRNILETHGEPLNPEESAAILAKFSGDGSSVPASTFAQKVMAK